MKEIRMLSLWQPWASLIAMGLKQYETRSWGTAYRGKIAIQAAKRPVSRDEILPILYATGGGGVSREELDRLDLLLEQDLPLGAIVAIADLTDCRVMATDILGKMKGLKSKLIYIQHQSVLERAVGNWQDGRCAWKLENAHPIAQPIPCKGAQGLRMIREAALLQAIEEQMALTDEQQLQAIGKQGDAP